MFRSVPCNFLNLKSALALCTPETTTTKIPPFTQVAGINSQHALSPFAPLFSGFVFSVRKKNGTLLHIRVDIFSFSEHSSFPCGWASGGRRGGQENVLHRPNRARRQHVRGATSEFHHEDRVAAAATATERRPWSTLLSRGLQPKGRRGSNHRPEFDEGLCPWHPSVQGQRKRRSDRTSARVGPPPGWAGGAGAGESRWGTGRPRRVRGSPQSSV